MSTITAEFSTADGAIRIGQEGWVLRTTKLDTWSKRKSTKHTFCDYEPGGMQSSEPTGAILTSSTIGRARVIEVVDVESRDYDERGHEVTSMVPGRVVVEML